MSNVTFSKSTSKSASKINQQTQERSSARWDTFLNLKFIEVPNSHFNVNGWKNVVRRFNEMIGRNYVYKQLRNHWDSMKKDWILFKKLLYKETGVGWNPMKNSLNASNEWWETKLKSNFSRTNFIQENGDYNKFRNKNLSLIWFRYNRLFSDIAATREKTREPSQRSRNEIGSGEDMLDDNGESNKVEEHVEISDSDDNDYVEIDEYNTNSEIMFPSLASVKRKFSGENSKWKKKFMENKSSTTSTPSTEITIGTAIEMLNNNYACNLLSKKDMREVFVNQPSHDLVSLGYSLTMISSRKINNFIVIEVSFLFIYLFCLQLD
ncbi:hypothetical protein Pfo_011526 [Paulownia fortunei]|nr:hypothetical protein Pfo_011526 [Paulownia fortunei]